jgi:hypothetical protein
MATLTWPTSDFKEVQQAWVRFRSLWWHKFGTSAYINVRQIGKGGKAHLHVLIDRFIPQRALSKMWRQASRGRAFVVDVREITGGEDSKRAASYVVGYISRSQNLPKRTRRYSVSQALYRILKQIQPVVAGFSRLDLRELGLEVVAQWSLHPWRIIMSLPPP